METVYSNDPPLTLATCPTNTLTKLSNYPNKFF